MNELYDFNEYVAFHQLARAYGVDKAHEMMVDASNCKSFIRYGHTLSIVNIVTWRETRFQEDWMNAIDLS